MGIKPIFMGRHEILDSQEEIVRQLLKIELAGRTSYRSYIGKEITIESATKFVRMLLRSGHESVLEHSGISVRFWDVSRGFTHELVRHRIAAYTQSSTRYIRYSEEDVGIILPVGKKLDDIVIVGERPITLQQHFESQLAYYQQALNDGWKAQDARQFLPIGIGSEIVITTNFREWRHIMKLRTAKDAHWEIRRSMSALLEEYKQIVPVIFEDFKIEGVDNNNISYYTTE